MNTVCLVGRLVRDPKCSMSQSGTAVASFSIAVDRVFKRDGEPTASFFSVVCFGKTAEFAEQYLRQGRLVSVCGRLDQRKYTGHDGQVRDSVEIVATEVRGLGPKPERDDRDHEVQRGTSRQQNGGDDEDPFA